MNSLSWFIYLAATLDNLAVVCIISVVVLSLLLGMWAIGHYLVEEVDNKPPTFLWVIWAAIITLLIFVPSKSTMYTIAASEVGERIAKNPDVQGIGKDAQEILRKWMKKQLSEKSE